MNLSKPNYLPRAALVLAFSIFANVNHSQAALTLWEVDLNFKELEGQTGGFESRPSNFSYVEYASKNVPGSSGTSRDYNIIKQVGNDPVSGSALFGKSATPVSGAPISIKTNIYSSQNNPWTRLRGGITNQGISSQMEAAPDKSRPGDWGVVAYEITIPQSYNVTADTVKIRLDNVNGSGELYEWAFVTVNETLDNTQINIGELNNYKSNVYSDLTNSSFYNSDGTPKTVGGVARPETELPKGQTVSQFLAGKPAGEPTQQVGNGWWAADKHNVSIKDGPEDFDSPEGGTGYTDNVFDVDYLGLGIDGQSNVTSLIVWMGYNDVGLDSNGDGFTKSGQLSQIGQIAALTIGMTDFSQVPEPSTGLLGLLTGVAYALRRKRR